eukprot:1147274-Pelagomonas_calceolata.AAC.7
MNQQSCIITIIIISSSGSSSSGSSSSGEQGPQYSMYGRGMSMRRSHFFILHADRMFCGDTEKAGSRILKDYRTGALGKFALELPLDLDKKQAREAAAAAAAAAAREKKEQRKKEGSF